MSENITEPEVGIFDQIAGGIQMIASLFGKELTKEQSKGLILVLGISVIGLVLLNFWIKRK